MKRVRHRIRKTSTVLTISMNHNTNGSTVEFNFKTKRNFNQKPHIYSPDCINESVTVCF